MTLDSIIILIGALIVILPFLGFPPQWSAYMVAVLGLIVVALGIIVRRRGGASGHAHMPEKQPAPAPLDDGEVA